MSISLIRAATNNVLGPIPPSGPLIHYNEVGIVDDGGGITITEWNNVGTGGTDYDLVAIGPQDPASLGRDSYNGLDTVRKFSTADRYLKTTSGIAIPSSDVSGTIVIVGRIVSASGAYFDNFLGGSALGLFSNGSSHWGVFVKGEEIDTGIVRFSDAHYVITIEFSSANGIVLSIQGREAEGSPWTNATPLNSDTLVWGKLFKGPFGRYQGWIDEFQYYEGILDSGVLTDLQAELTTKWATVEPV